MTLLMGRKNKEKAMKAIVYEEYGPPGVLEVRDLEKPAPGSGELLVRNQASPVISGPCLPISFTCLRSSG
jgi:hypothetical protein